MRVNILTIAASDPSGGAGIEADLKVFSAHQVFGLTAITAITIQDSQGVHGVFPVEVEVFRRVLETLAADQPLAAIKIGALASHGHLEAVSDFLASLQPLPPVVFDPVIRASSGAWLCTMDAVSHFERLFPFVTLITPNMPEAGVLAKMPVRNRAAMEEAARALCRRGVRAVLVKGGHLAENSVDLLCESGEIIAWPNERLPGEFHGTGCTLSAAIASRLAQGHELRAAVTLAREYLRLAMERARPGRGESWLLDFPPAPE